MTFTIFHNEIRFEMGFKSGKVDFINSLNSILFTFHKFESSQDEESTHNNASEPY